MAGALALAAVFLIAIVEMVFSPAGKGNGCSVPHQMMEGSVAKPEIVETTETVLNSPRDAKSRRMVPSSFFFCVILQKC